MADLRPDLGNGKTDAHLTHLMMARRFRAETPQEGESWETTIKTTGVTEMRHGEYTGPVTREPGIVYDGTGNHVTIWTDGRLWNVSGNWYGDWEILFQGLSPKECNRYCMEHGLRGHLAS